MTTCLHIKGGAVYDPANGIDGQLRDLFIIDGKLASALPDGASPRVIDATAMVVMPGGVDIHCHIASASVNRARMILGEEHATHVHRADESRGLRAGSGALTPSNHMDMGRRSGNTAPIARNAQAMRPQRLATSARSAIRSGNGRAK